MKCTNLFLHGELNTRHAESEFDSFEFVICKFNSKSKQNMLKFEINLRNM